MLPTIRERAGLAGMGETPLDPEDVGPTLDQIHSRFIVNNSLQGP